MFRSHLIYLVITSTVAIAFSGCNTRNPVIDATAPTVPSSIVVGAPTVPTSTLVSLIVDPSAVFSGGTAAGRVLLSFPAPASGVVVALSTSDPAVSVPASITVPAGGDAAQFTAATQSGASEVNVSITASAGDRALQAPLAVWTRTTPPFVASWTDPGNGQRIVANRVTRTGQWRANCYGEIVSVGAAAIPVIYSFLFGAPQGTPLIPGTYDNAQTIFTVPRSPSRPMLDISGPSFFSCGAPQVSRFTVSEVDLVADQLGTVRRLVVTFEQQCGAASIRGEAMVFGVAPTNTSGSRCIVR